MKKLIDLHIAKFPGFDERKSEFMRKGEVGSWKTYFSASQIKKFDDICREKMGEHGLQCLKSKY